jgi:predicted transcriptional regulator of viral defense system
VRQITFTLSKFEGIVSPVPTRPFEREVELFRKQGGSLRMSEALRLGINRKRLYAMRDAGVVEALSRGVYRLASLGPLAHPDLVTVAKRVTQSVVCLVSALSFHELTTQVPHTIDVALERGTTKPRLDYPPTRFFWFSGPAFHEGIETHTLDGTAVRIYDPEKTLVDCFRYRNRIGMDVVLEALRLWRERRRKKLDVLLQYACMRHVERAMRPYLEATS